VHFSTSNVTPPVQECRRCCRSSNRRAAETPGAQAERHLYLALLGALEAGLVRTVADALAVLRRASRPLGPMGAEWLEAQERQLRPPSSE
jgi:hypothetical protein